MIWALDDMARRICDMARRILLEGYDSLARRPNDPFCGHLWDDGAIEPFEMLIMLKEGLAFMYMMI